MFLTDYLFIQDKEFQYYMERHRQRRWAMLSDTEERQQISITEHLPTVQESFKASSEGEFTISVEMKYKFCKINSFM